MKTSMDFSISDILNGKKKEKIPRKNMRKGRRAAEKKKGRNEYSSTRISTILKSKRKGQKNLFTHPSIERERNKIINSRTDRQSTLE